MNVLEGSLAEGRFECSAGSFGTGSHGSGKAVVAGIRPEDGRLTARDSGHLAGEIYASELIGDHTLVTCRCSGATVTVKADKDFVGTIGQAVGVGFEERAVHLFDKASGERIP